MTTRDHFTSHFPLLLEELRRASLSLEELRRVARGAGARGIRQPLRVIRLRVARGLLMSVRSRVLRGPAEPVEEPRRRVAGRRAAAARRRL